MSLDVKNNYTLFPEIESTEKIKKHSKMPISNDATAVAYWSQCLTIIKDNVDKQQYITWFEPIVAHKWSDNKLTILVPSQWFFEWIEANYFDLLQKTIHRVLGKDASLQYEVVLDESKDSIESRTIKVPALKYPTNVHNGCVTNGNQIFNSNLHPRYVFDNFIVGENNNLAYSAAVAVGQNPGGTRYNPLFIYGGTGLGKTHLAQAIGNTIVSKNKRANVLYTNSERFTIDFVNAIQTNKIHEFANFYRSVDVLIVDDIQFLTGKEKTQDHFFHTFNDLYQTGKQLIFVSDRPPKELADIDARLISRFQWGLIADVQTPDLETRMAIINRKSEDEGLELSNDIVEFIAKHVRTSVREIEGVLISILAQITLDSKRLSIDMVQDIVFGSVAQQNGVIDTDSIKKAVSDYLNIDIKLMESKSRKHEVTVARQMAIYICKQLTDLSLKQIGSSFGGRDHSTVLHSCQAIENYLITDRAVKNAYDIIINKVKNN